MSEKLNIQDMIFKLEQFWASKGCMIMPSYDEQKGAGTMSPYTFLRAVGPEPWAACYVEPSRRPADGRYGPVPVLPDSSVTLQLPGAATSPPAGRI